MYAVKTRYKTVVLDVSLSVLTAIFPGGPWLVGTGMFPFWGDVGGGDNETEAIRRAIASSQNRHQQ